MAWVVRREAVEPSIAKLQLGAKKYLTRYGQKDIRCFPLLIPSDDYHALSRNALIIM